MRILHTADWHIGKKLYKRELSDDFELFIDWLLDVIDEESIDVVIVSGDIFDHANPSNDARSQYYRALLKLSKRGIEIVLTGGNHDSAQMLEAPKQLLRNLKIHIVGELSDNMSDIHIPIGGSTNRPEVIIAAIPYLRDADLRQFSEKYRETDRLEAVRNGIKRVFEESTAFCKQRFSDIPVIAMGHLYAAGVSTSESERDIQIGNLAGVEASVFGDYFEYVALGHIHKPQQVKGNIPIFYSGSPIALSFSERKDSKRVLIWDSDTRDVNSVDVPIFRVLKRISGTYAEIEQQLQSDFSGNALDTLLELELRELDFDPNVILSLDHLVQNFKQKGAEIIKHRIFFEREVQGAGEMYRDVYLEDLQPKEVFDKLLESHDINDDDRKLVDSAFAEIWDEVQNQSE